MSKPIGVNKFGPSGSKILNALVSPIIDKMTNGPNQGVMSLGLIFRSSGLES